jgi:hypothetical protein
LSLLHVVMAMLAVIGVIIAISLFLAPNGFGGYDVAYPLALVIAVVSVALISANIPFLTRVERISAQIRFSGLVSVISLGVYLGLFFSLLMQPSVAFPLGVVLGFGIWATIGGWRLFGMARQSA